MTLHLTCIIKMARWLQRALLNIVLMAGVVTMAHASDDDHDHTGHTTEDNTVGAHSDHLPQHDAVEGRTTLSATTVRKSGIVVTQAGPGIIDTQRHMFGVITPIAEQQYRVGSAYAGTVQQLNVKLGDTVKKDQLLAELLNPATLKNFSIRAPAAGQITANDVRVGEMVTTQTLFEITDLSTVYVEMSAFPADIEQLSLRAPFTVQDLHGHQSERSEISYIAPQMTGGHIARARGVLANPKGHWRPGMHVKADVTVASKQVAMLISKSALQRLNDKTVIFIRTGDVFEVLVPQLGAEDDRNIEVLSGVPLAAEYVSENSFILKADILKSGASHDH